jgi:hypothetical protein
LNPLDHPLESQQTRGVQRLAEFTAEFSGHRGTPRGTTGTAGRTCPTRFGPGGGGPVGRTPHLAAVLLLSIERLMKHCLQQRAVDTPQRQPSAHGGGDKASTHRASARRACRQTTYNADHADPDAAPPAGQGGARERVGIILRPGLSLLHRLREEEERVSYAAKRIVATRIDRQFLWDEVEPPRHATVMPTSPARTPLRRKEIAGRVGITVRSA